MASRFLLATAGNNFNDDQEDTIEKLNYVSSCFSIIGSVFIMVCILAFRKWRVFHFRLVFMLSFSDLIYSLCSLAGNVGREHGPESGECIMQGVVQQIFSTYAYLWVMSIAVTLYCGIVMDGSPQSDETAEKREQREHCLFLKYLGILTGYTAIVTIMPVFGNTYGDAGAWCWINNSPTGQVWRYVSFYIPVWICMAALTYMYYKIISSVVTVTVTEQDKADGTEEHAEEHVEEPHVQQFSALVLRLVAYPVIMFISYIFATINRIQNSAQPDNPSLALYGLATFFLNFNGFFNAVAYGLNASMQKEFKRLCSKEDAPQQEDTGSKEEERDLRETGRIVTAPKADFHQMVDPATDPSHKSAGGADHHDDGMEEIQLHDDQAQVDANAIVQMQDRSGLTNSGAPLRV